MLTVPVTVTCAPEDAFAEITIVVRQRVGQSIASGFGYLSGLVCDNTPHTYLLTVRAEARPFRAGRAVVEAFALVCNPEGCAGDTSGPVEIRVRKG